MNTPTIDARTKEGLFAAYTVRKTDKKYVLNIATGLKGRAHVIKHINYLFSFDPKIGVLRGANSPYSDTVPRNESYCWVPGPHSKESNPISRVLPLANLTRRLNEAQGVYRFELQERTILKITILKDSNL